jgi:hypothetical protein
MVSSECGLVTGSVDFGSHQSALPQTRHVEIDKGVDRPQARGKITQDRAMRIIAALIVLATPGLAFAVEPNPEAALTCEVVEQGRRTKLPAKRIRIEYPVECKLSVAGAARPEPFAARLATTWTDYDGPKAVPKKSERLTGKVNGGAPWTATLAPDKDFVGCLDFVIEAVLIAPGSDTKPAWSKTMKVKQFCPD